MQTHLVARSFHATLKPDKDVQVLFAIQPSSKAVLFIHGFSGDAIDTWSEFPLLLPIANRCHGHDLYFYGYDGLRADLTSSAALFRDFLDRLFSRTIELVNTNLPPAAQRPAGFTYDQMLVVAHSLGAVITRRALLDATRLGRDWAAKIQMLLFAPAHKGANVADLALEAASGFKFVRLFSALARFESPLIDQLKPGSDILKSLLEETQRARANDANPHLKARKVIIAEYEKIVRNETFGDDPPPESIPNTTHTSVCKPRADFRRPLEFLEECL